jgi:hypothetical protein
MPFAKRLALFAFILALASVILIFLSPVLVSNGLRLFLWWKGRQQGIKIEFQKIEAPFLKPVVIHQLHITSARPCLFQVDLATPRATFALNLRAILFHSNGRALHQAWIDGLRCEIRRDPRATNECNFDWHFLHQLLADEVSLTNVDLHISNGSTDFALHGGGWTASEIEAGKFAAREVIISTPFFHQRFADLRGATKWENDHLTLGALSLAHGLDIETITTDFSRLENKRIAIELNLDAFGGKIRVSIASENRDKGILWNVAGSASAVSLAQLSNAFGVRDPAGGVIRAAKFTFRGDAQNLSHATASIWTELSGFSWRDRVAETVMLGASLYNRQVEVEQVYVKQRNNQLTLSGEYTMPRKSADWINPNFRADISASIPDLGEFAKLFGGTTKNFAGELTITGTVNGRERNVAGQIMLEGSTLRIAGAPFDTLRAKLTLKDAQLSLDSLQARQHEDFFNATGEVNLTRDHRYSIKANGAIAELSDYSSLLPESWRALQPQGRASIGWDGHGAAAAHSGDFRIQADNVRLTSRLGLRPFNVRLDGTYSPQNVFFREFRFSNPQAEFNAFVSIAHEYLQLQDVRFDLNGKPKLHGKIFVPVALRRWSRSRSFDDFDAKQNFDIDLTLDELDLAELQSAISDQTSLAGKINGRFESYGSLHGLQAKCDLHLRDFSRADPHRVSADLHAESAADIFKLALSANAASSSQAQFDLALPLELAGSVFFARDKPMTFKVNCPAIVLSKLPRYLTRVSFRDGIVSANLEGAGTSRNPTITGNIACVNGRLAKSPGPIAAANGQIDFHGSSADITFANLELTDARLLFHGAINFSDTSNVSIKLIPESPIYELAGVAPTKCIASVNIFGARQIDPETNALPEIRDVELHGGLDLHLWRIALRKDDSAQLPESFSFCESDGDVLQLALPPSQRIEFGQHALGILRGRSRTPNFKPLPFP